MTELIDANGRRIDGRAINELRPTKLEVGVLKNADGSAYIEMGKNKIVVAVYGPREVHPRHLSIPDRALLKCRYHMSPFSVETRKSPAPSRREIEISKVIREALEPALVLDDYPRTAINVYVEVLQSDGGSRCAGITAAAVALADAGINMRDIVVACAAGKASNRIVLDPNDAEDKEGQADMPIAIMPNLGQVTLLQLDGILTLEEFDQCFKQAMEGCKTLSQMQKDALMNHFFGNAQPSQESE